MNEKIFECTGELIFKCIKTEFGELKMEYKTGPKDDPEYNISIPTDMTEALYILMLQHDVSVEDLRKRDEENYSNMVGDDF